MTEQIGECIGNYTPFPDDYPLRQELIDYGRQVLDGSIIACPKHKWACERFRRDLGREGTDEFPYLFDQSRALDFLNWMKLFKHRKGPLDGQRIDPHIIQKFIFGNIYGWIHKATEYRRFRRGYWQVGKKNAKSQSLACVGSYELMAFGQGASEVYCAASKTDQAKLVWDETEAMLKGCDELRGRYTVSYGRIRHPKSGSIMRALSKEDRRTGDGLNPQCGIVDEYHCHEDTAIYDVMVSGMVARPQPLIMIITTAGLDLNNPCYRIEYQYVSDILNPNRPITNDRYFVMINELEKDDEGNLVDDIRDERAWPKANPIVCSYPEGLDSLREMVSAALDAPEKMREFLTKNMNVWVDAKPQGYMDMAKWALCKGVVPDLRGRACVLGVDLSAKIDLTSVSFEFHLDDGKYVVLSHSFMPEDKLAEKRKVDKVPYDLWVKQGYISPTPGAVVDYRFMKQYILDRFQQSGWVKGEMPYDEWNAGQFPQDMQDEGFTPVAISQTIKGLNDATKDLREQAYQKNVIHDGNPVLTWAMGNAVTRVDSQGNIMLDKSKARERIDPVAALMNSHVRAMAAQPKKPLGPQVLIF